MTDFDTALISQTHPATPEISRASTPAQIAGGYAALREMLPRMVTMLRGLIGRRGAKGLARRIGADLREIYRQEKAAMGKMITQAMRSCPDWCARVFEDLGGAAALARWEARLLRAYAPPPEEDYSWLDDDPEEWPIIESVTPRRSSERRPRSGPRLDRDGLFRWASIEQPRHLRHSRAPRAPEAETYEFESLETAPPLCRARPTFAGPWPLEVRPCDLLDPPEPEDEVTISLNPQALWAACIEDVLRCNLELTDIKAELWPRQRAARIGVD